MYKYEYAYTIQTEFRLLPEYANRSVFSLLYFLWIYFVHILFGCRTHPIANIRSGASVHIRWCPSEIQKNLMRKQWCRIFLVKCNLFYIFQLFIFVYILAHFAWLIFRKLQMEKVFELRNNCTAKAFWAEASYIYIPHNRKCVTLCVAEIFFCFFSGIFYSREISTRTEQNKATSALIECMIFGVRLRISQANTKSLRFSGVGFVLLLYNSNSNSNSPFCTSSSNTFVDTI